jgi:hypothetical protein
VLRLSAAFIVFDLSKRDLLLFRVLRSITRSEYGVAKAKIQDPCNVRGRAWDEYAQRDETRREHLLELQTPYGFRSFTLLAGQGTAKFVMWEMILRLFSNLSPVSRETSCDTSGLENKAAIHQQKNSANDGTSQINQVVPLKEPEPRRLVPASGDKRAAIRADRHRKDPSIVAQHHGVSSRILCPQIPEPRRPVPASGDKPAAIRADRHRSDLSIVAAQNDRVSSRIFCPQVPEPRRVVSASVWLF